MQIRMGLLTIDESFVFEFSRGGWYFRGPSLLLERYSAETVLSALVTLRTVPFFFKFQKR